MRVLRVLAVAMVGAAVIALLASGRLRMESDGRSEKTHVVLVGASIGQGWKIADWPNRTGALEFSAESIPVWQFDKSAAVDEIIRRPHRRFQFSRKFLQDLVVPAPKGDIVILKECSSYFPGDLIAYEGWVRKWVELLRGRKIGVILATVVSITQTRANREPAKQTALLEYNRWIRQYAHELNIPVLDLEGALRELGPEAYLRTDFAAEDGSHLNASAYARLDQVLLDTISPNGGKRRQQRAPDERDCGFVP